MINAAQIIEALELNPHPEGGHYRETWRAPAAQGQRAAGTAIYYLLQASEVSHWHRINATEIWHWYAGAPLELSLSRDGQQTDRQILGPNLAAGEQPQIIIAKRVWQSAKSLGDWTLAGCTVVPGFEFSGFELAPPDWQPG